MREIQLALYEIDKKTMMELYMKLQEQVYKLNNLISPLLQEVKAKKNGNTQQNRTDWSSPAMD